MLKEDSQKMLSEYIMANPGEKLEHIALKLGWGAAKTLWVFKSLGADFGYGAFHQTNLGKTPMVLVK